MGKLRKSQKKTEKSFMNVQKKKLKKQLISDYYDFAIMYTKFLNSTNLIS